MAVIMIVEDEPAILDLLKINLQLVGHSVLCCDHGDQVIGLIQRQRPDLILLDVMLPGKDGFQLMKEIRPMEIPVIFLTAKEQTKDKITGLQLGADDYIVKPFVTIEVITRIEVVLRRCRKVPSIFCCDNLEVKFAERTVYLNQIQVDLTIKEYELLEVLIINKNIALSRERLLELVWGYDYIGESRTIDVHIQRLRKKLELEDKIKTVFKVGYRLEVPQ